MRLGFVQHKIVLSLSPILHKLDEGIGRKRVVLRRNAEPLPGLLRITVFRFQRVHLPYNLASVAEKFHALRGQCDAGSMPIEDAEADALLDFPDRIGQTWLRDEQRVRGFGYRPLFGYRNQIA